MLLTPQFAKQFGRKRVFLATAIPLFCLALVGLYYETRGDFANGILFFTVAIFNIRVIILLLLIAGLSYFLGGKAGIDIIIKHKNFVITGLKYASIISFVLLLYSMALNYISKTFDRENAVQFIFSQLWVFIPFMLIWLFAGNMMRLKAKKINSHQ